MKTIITFIIVFGILVLVHEFGHFFFAKRAGILVREFAIGMGPKIFSHRSAEGTLYTIRILPVGGYVRMAGGEGDRSELRPGMPLAVVLAPDGKVCRINASQKVQLPNGVPMELQEADLEDQLFLTGLVNDEEVTYQVAHDATIIEEDGTEIRIAPIDVQFQSAKLSQRMLTNFAGPLNNFILAVILFTVVVFMQGGVSVTDTNRIGMVVEDMPAAQAGLQENDEILSINDEKIQSWDDFLTIVQAHPNEQLNFVVKRKEQTLHVKVKTESTEVSGEKVGRIGVSQPKNTGFFDKIIGGFTMTLDNAFEIFRGLGSLLTGFSLNKLGGPVMMYQLSEEASNAGTGTVIFLMAILSVNLGIFNLLPIPALDGGKLVLNIIEGIRKKPINPEKEGILTLVGAGFLFILMILVTWNDIQRFFF